MGQTLIEKIISQHSGIYATPGEIVDVAIDVSEDDVERFRTLKEAEAFAIKISQLP